MRRSANLLPLLLLLGCPTDVDDPASADGELHDPFIEGRHCDEDSPLTWQSFGQPFLLENCTGCHGSAVAEEHRSEAPVGVDFDTLESVQADVGRVFFASADDNDWMPPVDSISDETRRMLGDWLACGAP